MNKVCLPWPRPWLVKQYNDKVGDDDLAGCKEEQSRGEDEEESLARKDETGRDGNGLCINGGSDQQPSERACSSTTQGCCREVVDKQKSVTKYLDKVSVTAHGARAQGSLH